MPDPSSNVQFGGDSGAPYAAGSTDPNNYSIPSPSNKATMSGQPQDRTMNDSFIQRKGGRNKVQPFSKTTAGSSTYQVQQ